MKKNTGNAFALFALLFSALGVATGANAQTAAPAADAPVVTVPAPAADAPIVSAPASPPAAAPAPAAQPVEATKPEKIAEPKPKPRAKPKPKAKPAPEAPASFTITVNNARSVALTELEAGASGSEPATVLGALAPGQAASVKIRRGGDCLYDLHGDYDDGSTTDLRGVDLCKIKSLRLME